VNVELFNSIKRILEEEYQKRRAGQGEGGAEESNGKKTKKMDECLGDGKYTILNVSKVNHPFSEVCLLLNFNLIFFSHQG